MIALPVLLLALFATNDASDVLLRTAVAYENLRSFEITASLSFKVPGQDLTVTTGQTAVYAASSMLPADAPVPLLQLGTVGGRPLFRNGKGEAVKPKVAGFSFTVDGFPFLSLSVVDKRVISARALPDETLVAGGRSIDCRVIEAVYQKRSEFGRGRPIRMWIDKETWLVRQAQFFGPWRPFSEELAEWTARVDKMTLDQPPSQWALDHMAKLAGLQKPEETKWNGQPAPDFAMKSVEGQPVSLADLRGKVVVLNFWATWCGPCREEMPLLERLREELKPQGVEIWGVTDENLDVARRWLSDRKRTLPTLLDSDHALFRHYAIESIPVLLVLRPDGKVSSFLIGLRGEQDLRAAIAKAREPRPPGASTN